MSDDTPRWLYRFNNYKRALALLRKAIELMESRDLSDLEKEGVVQRFEYTMELSWKVMKDYLESENVVFDQVTPRSVIRMGFEANLLIDGDLWMEMLDARNLMSHEYELEEFEELIEDLRHRYIDAFDKLHQKLLALRT